MNHYDCAIIGAGASGLAAAMVLVRACRKVVVIDAHQQSNLVSNATHGVFTRDGVSPEMLYKLAKSDLLNYKTIEFLDDTVVSAKKANEAFSLEIASRKIITCDAVLLAQGVTYRLPKITGVDLLWGTKVWHCPYCDGFESRDKKILMLGSKSWSKEMQEIIYAWTDDFVCMTPDKVISVENTDNEIKIQLRDDTVRYAQGILIEAETIPSNKIAKQLGCKTWIVDILTHLKEGDSL